MKWSSKIEQKIHDNEYIDILDEFPIRKDLWLKNFVKSAVSTSLFALGFNFIFEGTNNNNMQQVGLGIIAVLVAVIVIFVIDSYHQKVRELELKAIDNNQALSYEYVDEQVEKIVKKAILKSLNDEE